MGSDDEKIWAEINRLHMLYQAELAEAKGTLAAFVAAFAADAAATERQQVVDGR